MKNLLTDYFRIFIYSGILFICSCATPKNIRITSNGIPLYSIGDPLSFAREIEIPNVVAKDTNFTDQEYIWRAVILKSSSGKIFLEEDFDNGSILNRIRIETPEVKLKNGIKVGDNVKRLKSTHSRWYISQLQEQGLFDFYSMKFPQIHFLVKDETVLGDIETIYDIGMFNSKDLVKGIVVY